MTEISTRLGRRPCGKMTAAHPYDRILCMILSNFRVLKHINPVNSADYRHKYLSGDIPSKCPDFKYKDINFDINAVKETLLTLTPFNEKTLILHLKAKEIHHKLMLVEARNTRTFREISRLLYGSVSVNELRQVSEWLNIEDDVATKIHYDSKAMKTKLDAKIRQMGLDVRVILRQFLTSKAAAGFDTLGIKARGTYSFEDYIRIVAHEIETHIYRTRNGIDQELKSLFYHGFPRSDSIPGGYLLTEEGLALMMEEKAGVLTHKRKRIIAARVLAIYLMDVEELNFNEVFEVLTKTHHFSANSAYDICIRTFRAGGYTKDHIYFRGYEYVKTFFENYDVDYQKLLFVGKIGIEWLPFVKTMQDNGKIVAPKLLPEFFAEI